jgi:hypothetical protein
MNLNNIVPQNDVETLPHESEEIAARAVHQATNELEPSESFIDGDAINWEVLANDATILRMYGMREHEAVEKVFDAFRSQFLNRLRAELKARRTAAWKAETFDQLKKEFGHE